MSLLLDAPPVMGAQRPRVECFPAAPCSAAPEFIDLASVAGVELDGWQRYVLTHGLGEDAARTRWAALKVGCWTPRQNGKGGIIEALELGWLFLTRERLIMHSAHEYKTAAEAFRRITALIEDCPDLDRCVANIWRAAGEQGIELTRRAGGGRLRFVARSRTSGRGFTGDKSVFDEGQEVTAEQMAAGMPTMSARPNPQMWFFGTPPSAGTAWCYRLRLDGQNAAPRTAWFDWGADLDPDAEADHQRAAADRSLWWQCNPAMGIRISEEFVEGEATPSGLGELFMAERLGVWPNPVLCGGGLITEAAWAAVKDEGSKRVGPHVSFAVDVNPARSHSSIAAWGLRADGVPHGELIEYRPGTKWVAGRCAELAAKHSPLSFAMDARGPAGSLVDALDEVGITVPEDAEHPHHGHLAIPSLGEFAAACGQMLDAIANAEFRHIGQGPLTRAAHGASPRNIGDGATGFGRVASDVDISPLVALTVARWAFGRADLDADYDLLESVW